MTPQKTIYRLSTGVPVEKDWLMMLTGKMNASWRQFASVDDIRPGTVFFYCGFEAMKIPSEILEKVRDVGGCGLIHIGDEYYRSDVRQYAAFDYIVRNSPADFLASEGVHFLPLGYTSGLPKVDVKLASQRKYSLMFAGDAKADRELMARKMSRVEGSFISLPRKRLGERNISRNEYVQILMDSVFAPSPAGNINIETYRPYEAVQLGSIPILPKRQKIDIYTDLLGDHPFPTFLDWGEAAIFCANMMKDPQGLDQLQAECMDWWKAKEESLSVELRNFIQNGERGLYREELQKKFGRMRLVSQKRMNFFLKQQNGEQLKVRASSKFMSAVAKVKGRKYSRPNWTMDKPAGDQDNIW